MIFFVMTFEILNFYLWYWSIFLAIANSAQQFNEYKKSLIEDLCLFNESFEYVLENSGLYSAIKIGATTSSSFNDRNCTIEIDSTVRRGVILKVYPMYFGHNISSECSDYLQVYDDNGNSTTLCGLHTESSVFITKNNMKLQYYTTSRNILIAGEGFTLVATSFTKNKRICKSNHFICATGECIWEGFTCDGIENCPDSSDEKKFCDGNGHITTKTSIHNWIQTSPAPIITPKSSFEKSSNAVVGISVAAAVLIIFFLVAYSYADISGLVRSFYQYYRDNTRGANSNNPRSECPSAPPLTLIMNDTDNDPSSPFDTSFTNADIPVTRYNNTIYNERNRIPENSPISDQPPSYELAMGMQKKK